MKVSFVLGVVCFVCILFGVECIQWKSCDANAKSKVSSVAVGGCEQTPVCQMKKGQNATFSVTFTINEDAASAKAVVHGIIDKIPVPFPLDNPDACKDCGLTCPLNNGKTYTYTTKIFVKTVYPSIRLIVKFELVDPAGNDIFCVELPAEIVDAAKQDNKLRFAPRP